MKYSMNLKCPVCDGVIVNKKQPSFKKENEIIATVNKIIPYCSKCNRIYDLSINYNEIDIIIIMEEI